MPHTDTSRPGLILTVSHVAAVAVLYPALRSFSLGNSGVNFLFSSKTNITALMWFDLS